MKFMVDSHRGMCYPMSNIDMSIHDMLLLDIFLSFMVRRDIIG